jgi:hypothetical protein
MRAFLLGVLFAVASMPGRGQGTAERPPDARPLADDLAGAWEMVGWDVGTAVDVLALPSKSTATG